MRTLRALVALSIFTWIAGCGGDDSSPDSPSTPDSSTGTPDSSKPPTDSSTGDAPTTEQPSAKATSVTLYIGGMAKLDATGSAGAPTLAYAWKVTSVPAGSAIVDASLTGAATASVTFTPDKVGAYELELTVSSSAAGTTPSKTKATATVVDAPLFYFDSQEDAGSQARLLVTGATAGDGGKPVACFERDSGTYSTIVRQSASAGTDWWEGPPGQPAKAVFVMDAPFDGGQAAALFATTSAASCATAPTKLDSLPPAAGGAEHTFEQPRISPDGTRVAYVRSGADGARVATVGLDGANLRILGTRIADGDGGSTDAGLSIVLSRPFWIGTTQVGWVEQIDNDNWQVVRATDGATPTRELMMKCTGATPQQAAALANGDILVSQAKPGGSQLLAYPVQAATKTCGAARVLTPLPDGGATAYDFALSPDGKEVAYLGIETGGGNPEVRAVRVDGTGSPRKIGALGQAQRGPRYLASGSFVSWGLVGTTVDAGDGGSFEGGVLAVLPVDGGDMHVAANAPTIQAIGNGIFNCGIGNAAGSGVAFFGVTAIAALRFVRRRRR